MKELKIHVYKVFVMGKESVFEYHTEGQSLSLQRHPSESSTLAALSKVIKFEVIRFLGCNNISDTFEASIDFSPYHDIIIRPGFKIRCCLPLTDDEKGTFLKAFI
jgi:hypothetical protein